MTILISTTNGTTTLAFSYQAEELQAARIIDLAAHALFEEGNGDHGTPQDPRTYNQQTENEKLIMLDANMLKQLMNTRYNQDEREANAVKKTAINLAKQEPKFT